MANDLTTSTATSTHSAERAGLIAYVVAPTQPLYTEPLVTFDGVLTELAYAQPVILGYSTNGFQAVTQGQYRGWVPAEALTTDVSRVYPPLVAGVAYAADHPVTERVRLVLKDSFLAGALRLPVTPEEYVSYELAQQQRQLPWGIGRPRLAGTWHRQLRGDRAIHVGVEPRTHAIMEWVDADGVGQLAWVVAVHPDESIRLGFVRNDGVGTFVQTTWNEDEWRECRPVFISCL